MKVRTIIGFVIIMLWIALMWQLQQKIKQKNILEQEAEVSLIDGTVTVREEWLGLYLENKKVGYTMMALREYQKINDFPPELNAPYLLENITSLTLPIMGNNTKVTYFTKALLGNNLELIYFKYRFSSHKPGLQNKAEVSLATEGQYQPEKAVLTVKTKSGEEEITTEIPVANKVYLPDIVHTALALTPQNLKPGKKLNFSVFNPLLSINHNLSIEVKNQEQIKIKGQEFKAWHLTEAIADYVQQAWIDEKGRSLKQFSSIAGLPLIALAEKKELAQKPPTTRLKIDLIEKSRIETKTKINQPQKVTYLKVKINTGTKWPIIEDCRQKITVIPEEPKYVYLEINSFSPERPLVNNGNLACEPKADLEKYLASDLYIQAQAKPIIEKTQLITQNLTDNWEKAKALANWTRENMQASYKITVPSALDILSSLEGDCNEHSTLLAAFCRSIGIPCKIVVGIAYMNGAFYYHAWNEVYLTGNIPHWVAVDATWGETLVDATHIKLAEGDLKDQIAILGKIGKLKISIEEYK